MHTVIKCEDNKIKIPCEYFEQPYKETYTVKIIPRYECNFGEDVPSIYSSELNYIICDGYFIFKFSDGELGDFDLSCGEARLTICDGDKDIYTTIINVQANLKHK